MHRSVLLCFLFSLSALAGVDDKCRPQPDCEKNQPPPSFVPTPIPPLWMAGKCDRCNGIPVDLYMMQCPMGQVPKCQTSASWPPLRTCPQVTYGICVDAPIEGTVFPKFQVLFVAYSPPGRGSSVTYAAGTSVGSTITVANTWQNSTDMGITIGANVIVAQGAVTVSSNATVSGKSTRQEDVSFQQSESMRIPGQGDFVNHDWDQIWFLVKPAIHVKVQERPGPPYPVATEVSWQYEDHQRVTTFWVYVGELNGHIQIPPEVRAQMDAWGITPDFYPTLLQADPLVWPTNMYTTDSDGRPIVLMPAAGDPAQNFDAHRFELVEVLPYRPLGSPTEQPTVITYNVQQSQTQAFTSEVTQSYSVGGDYSATFNFLLLARWRFADKFTFTNSTSVKLSNGKSTTDTLTLGQPSFGYAGPVVLYVYEDKIWHTYAFRLE